MDKLPVLSLFVFFYLLKRTPSRIIFLFPNKLCWGRCRLCKTNLHQYQISINTKSEVIHLRLVMSQIAWLSHHLNQIITEYYTDDRLIQIVMIYIDITLIEKWWLVTQFGSTITPPPPWDVHVSGVSIVTWGQLVQLVLQLFHFVWMSVWASWFGILVDPPS